MEPLVNCKKCQLPILPSFYFCPNCANPLRSKPLPITIGKQIGIYLLSLLLPPLGLVPGIKYLFQKSGKAKMVGMVAVLLTIISTVVTLYYASIFIKKFTDQLNGGLGGSLDTQFNPQLQQNLDQLPK